MEVFWKKRVSLCWPIFQGDFLQIRLGQGIFRQLRKVEKIDRPPLFSADQTFFDQLKAQVWSITPSDYNIQQQCCLITKSLDFGDLLKAKKNSSNALVYTHLGLKGRPVI